MSTNKKFDDIMREIIQAKNKSIMSEYEKIAEESENTPIGAIDENIIKAVIEYDKKEKSKKKKKYLSVFSRVAILLITCAVSVSFIFPESVEAFRVKMFNALFNDESGSISLSEEANNDLLSEWTKYYYPKYMLDNYNLVAAEKIGERSIMLFVSEDGKHQLKIESIPVNSTINIDTDNTNIENVAIGYYEGIYAVDSENENVMITFINENAIMKVQGDTSIDKDKYIKIAENLKYIDK